MRALSLGESEPATEGLLNLVTVGQAYEQNKWSSLAGAPPDPITAQTIHVSP